MAFFARHYNKILTAAEVTADFFAIFLAFSAGSAIFLSNHPLLTYNPHYTLVCDITCIVGILIFERMGLYRQQVSLMNLIEIRKIIKAVFVLCTGLIIYSYFQEKHFPRSLLVYIGMLLFFFVLTERMLFFKLQQALYIRRFNVSRILILGAGETGRLLHQNISQSPKLGYLVVGFLDSNKERLLLAQTWFATGKKTDLIFCDDFNKLPEIIQTAKIDEIFISNPLNSMNGYTLQSLAKLCNELQIKLNFIPYVIRGYFANHLQANDINGIPVVSFKRIPVNHPAQLSKRIFDVIIAGFLIIILSPLFLLIALLVRLDSAGPVLFKQTRVGKNGVHFTMYKF
ncbi:MAG: hypothetical protein DSY80_08490, partial [Desulfocapsa sp.]